MKGASSPRRRTWPPSSRDWPPPIRVRLADARYLLFSPQRTQRDVDKTVKVGRNVRTFVVGLFPRGSIQLAAPVRQFLKASFSICVHPRHLWINPLERHLRSLDVHHRLGKAKLLDRLADLSPRHRAVEIVPDQPAAGRERVVRFAAVVLTCSKSCLPSMNPGISAVWFTSPVMVSGS